MAATDSVTTAARELALRFIDAFDTRDAASLRRLVAQDAELRTMSSRVLHGHEGSARCWRPVAFAVRPFG